MRLHSYRRDRVRHVPSRDGSVLMWNVESTALAAVLAAPFDEDDPYECVGGEA